MMHDTSVTVGSEGAGGAAPAPRTRIGRYAIEGVLGAGGMAVVYLARDPVLGRAVALKVLRVGGDERSARRLVREGQALARVSHPNVISVYEVGRETDGLIYIAMERIAGTTLAAWLEAPRAQRDILAVFAAAGRGLSAAHAAGLVHRDFKPENVMVGDDGRVCVLDFGLARAPAGDDSIDLEDTLRSPSDALAVTASGGVVGTPAYMSPEQWRGERAGVQSDQFSFCVALWRALTGEHPFDLRSREALRASVIAGRIRCARTALPRRLRGVLRRGMASDPRARLPSIDAIIGEIAPRAARPWLTPATVVATAAAALAPYLIIGASGAATAATQAPAVSPDGQRVAWLTPDAVTVQALAPGGEPRVVLRGARAHHALSWSPDSRRLALIAAVAGSAAPPGVVVIDVATGAVHRLDDHLGALAPLE